MLCKNKNFAFFKLFFLIREDLLLIHEIFPRNDNDGSAEIFEK